MNMPVPTWQPEPRADADELIASAKANRDGVVEDDGLSNEDVEVLSGPPTGVL